LKIVGIARAIDYNDMSWKVEIERRNYMMIDAVYLSKRIIIVSIRNRIMMVVSLVTNIYLEVEYQK
jgi:hypothetical protein